MSDIWFYDLRMFFNSMTSSGTFGVLFSAAVSPAGRGPQRWLSYDADAESRAVSQGALDMPAWPMAATSTLSVASGKSIGNQVYNVEWTNSTSYYFNSTSCPATHHHPATRAHDCLADDTAWPMVDCHVSTQIPRVLHHCIIMSSLIFFSREIEVVKFLQ